MNTENKKACTLRDGCVQVLFFSGIVTPFRGVRREAKRAWLAWRLERLEA